MKLLNADAVLTLARSIAAGAKPDLARLRTGKTLPRLKKSSTGRSNLQQEMLSDDRAGFAHAWPLVNDRLPNFA